MESKEKENLILNSYILGSGKIIVAIINFLHFLLLIRLLSIKEYALLTIGFLIPDIFSLFGELGLDYASTHFISKLRQKNKSFEIKNIIRLNFIIKIIVGFFFLIIVAFNAEFIAREIYRNNNDTLIGLIQLSSFEIFSRMLFNATISILLGFGRFKLIRTEIIVRMICRTTLSISLIYFGLNVYGPVIGYFVSNASIFLLNFIIIRKINSRGDVDEKSKTSAIFMKMLKYGYPLMFCSFIVSIQTPIYLYILVLTSNLQNISYFKTAVDSAKTINILTQAIALVLFPAFSKLDWKNEEDKRELILNYTLSLKFSSIIILPSTCILIIFSSEIFPFLYGKDYIPAAIFYSMYFVLYLFISFGSITIPEFLKGQKQTKSVLYIELINIICSMFFGIIFISFYSTIGLVIGIILGRGISLLYATVLIYRKYGIILFKNYKNILIIFTIAIIGSLFAYFLYFLILSFISIEFFLIKLMLIIILSIFYFGLFLFLIGLFSQISVKELEYFENSFKNVIFINKLMTYLVNIERKIILLRKVEKEI